MEKKKEDQYLFVIKQIEGQKERLKAFISCMGKYAGTDFSNNILDVASKMSPSLYVASKTNDSISKSQYMQDYFSLVFNNGKKDGYFVEFGACDGKHLNNTYLLEKEFGWRGILSEPARVWHGDLKKNRSAIIDTRCVWRGTGDILEFNESSLGGQSSIEGYGAAEKNLSQKYDVETVSLVDLLIEHKAPKFIDYLSMDTEGSEYEILKSFPFDTFRFGFITVEHHAIAQEEKIKDILNQAGYKQILRNISGWDGFYVPIDLACFIQEGIL